MWERLTVETWCVCDVLLAHGFHHGIIRRHGIIGVALGAAAPRESRVLEVVADEAVRGITLLHRKYAAVILEQDNAIGDELPHESAVLRRVGSRRIPSPRPCRGSHLVNEPEHISRSIIDSGAGDLARIHGDGEQTAPELCRPRHLEVQARIDGLGRAVGSPPVAHDEAVETPFISEYLLQQQRVLARVHAIDHVIARHDGPGVRMAARELEGQQVHLAQGALGHADVVLDRVCGLVVGGEVLDAGCDAAVLDAGDVGGGEEAAEDGVLGEGLEAAAHEGGALEADGRGEEGVDVFAAGFGAQEGADAAEQGDVEGGAHGCCGGEEDAGDSRKLPRATETMRSI